MSNVLTIILVVFGSVTAPLILAYLNGRQQRKAQRADWDRQDEVAAKAEKAQEELAKSQKQIASQAAEAAKLLVDAQAETIRRSDEVATLAAERDAIQSAKLGQIEAQAKRIHTLVNSDMTAARQSERDQTVAMAAVLRRVIGLAESRGQNADLSDVEALRVAEDRVHTLDGILADRLQQMREVEANAANPESIVLEEDSAGEGGG